MVKYLFVTGGVASSIGKGITASALGFLLKSRGLNVTMQKLDPYINVDPGTMNPDEHGEVFVTDDGGETDLDLGHYERFIDLSLTRDSSVTTGSIYASVINMERQGRYLGKTVQVIPHITDEIKCRIQALETSDVDIVITEIGGTVGDIEILPFLEAVRQFRNEVGRDNVCSVHITLVPHLGPTGEQKTKPTQHSVTELRSRGIQPDAIVCRSSAPISDKLKSKISDLCDVPAQAVFSAVDASNIYDIPLSLHEEGFDEYICSHLRLTDRVREPDLRDWQELTDRARVTTEQVKIGMVVKYDMRDAYLSVVEALRHASWAEFMSAELVWLQAQDIEKQSAEVLLAGLDAIVICGGFGERGLEGKIAAARYARENQLPCLGLCLGLQMMVVDYARHVAMLEGASSRELNPEAPHLVIDLLDEQRRVVGKGGTMRLGSQVAVLVSGSQVAEAYGEPIAFERHRHRLEVSPRYRSRLEAAGLLCSGTSPDNQLVEFVELPGHPFWMATQAHPELKSRPRRPHPLFRRLIHAASVHRDSEKLDSTRLLSG